jgi:hypothetical protein
MAMRPYNLLSLATDRPLSMEGTLHGRAEHVFRGRSPVAPTGYEGRDMYPVSHIPNPQSLIPSPLSLITYHLSPLLR